MGTLEQITKLIDAGYTKEEITELFKQTGTQPAAKEPEPKQAEPAKTAEPAPQLAGFEKLDAAIEKMDKLADGIAKIAIMNSNQPPKQNTDDFLAQIINPRLGKEN